MPQEPIKVDDAEAQYLYFEVGARCEKCGLETTITLISMSGTEIDACADVCECGEAQWLVRFTSHANAVQQTFSGGGVA